MFRRALAVSVTVLLLATGLAVGQSTPIYADDLFAASDSMKRALDKFCDTHPEHHRCATTTTDEPTTTEAPTTTQIVTTTTTLSPTTTTTEPTTTTAAPTTTTTTSPTACVGFQVAAGANLATLAQAQPNNTTFCLAPGTFPVTTPINARDGQDWIGALGSDGERLSILTGNDSTEYAFATTSPNVNLRNIIIEKFENPVQKSVLQGLAPSRRFWTIDNVEARFNKGIGLSVNSGGVIRNSYIHHNEQMGLSGWCGGSGEASCLIENNEVSFNNYLGLHDPNWEAGGSKFVGTTGQVIRGNNFHHNCGPGIWFDGNNQLAVIEGNTTSANAGFGIFYEINKSSAVIRNNVVSNDAHGTLGAGGPVCRAGYHGDVGGIVVSSSTNVEVHGNILSGNDGGIAGYSNTRVGGASCPSTDPCVLTGLWVHDNDVSFSVGWNGVLDFTSGNAAYGAAANNRFDGNDYSSPLARPFQWSDGLRTFVEWRGFGHDLNGSLN